MPIHIAVGDADTSVLSIHVGHIMCPTIVSLVIFRSCIIDAYTLLIVQFRAGYVFDVMGLGVTMLRELVFSSVSHVTPLTSIG